MSVDFKNDMRKVKDVVGDKDRKVLYITTGQVLSDCNDFCRIDKGDLARSSLVSSDLANGKIAYTTPYAKKVYFTGKPNLQKNPNASIMWCERARTERAGLWMRVFANAVKNEMEKI